MDGIAGDYDPAWFDVLRRVEERHFWFRARKRIIGTVVGQLVAELGPRARLLEVGCGTGDVLSLLAGLCPDGYVVGLDPFEEALAHARQRCECALVTGDLLDAPFDDGAFDVVGMFDVLEHLPDDGRALEAVGSLLSPGGALVLTVPACRALFHRFDEAAGHYRRYETADLAAKLDRAGLEPTYVSPFMTTIFPLVWVARRWLGSRNSASAELSVRPVLNGLLCRLLAWEHRWIERRRRLPFGTSLLAVARKR